IRLMAAGWLTNRMNRDALKYMSGRFQGREGNGGFRQRAAAIPRGPATGVNFCSKVRTTESWCRSTPRKMEVSILGNRDYGRPQLSCVRLHLLPSTCILRASD